MYSLTKIEVRYSKTRDEKNTCENKIYSGIALYYVTADIVS